MTLALYITLSRIFISPVFFLIYLYYIDLGLSLFSLAIFLIALLAISEISDAIDGYFARKYDEVTDLGKVLDPMADSMCHISMFLTFTLAPVNIPMGFVFLFLYRDFVVSSLRTICALRGIALAARPSGKIKAVLQGVSVLAVLVLIALHGKEIITQQMLTWYSTLIVGGVAAYTLFSGLDYIFANRGYVKRLTARSNINLEK